MSIDIQILLKEEVQQFIRDHENHDPYQLLLQAGKFPGIPLKEAVNQIKARKKAREKIPSWYNTPGIVFPPLSSLEQSSSEITARYKSNLVKGADLVDLTGGFGVDTWFLSQSFIKTTYVESNPDLTSLAEHNFKVLGAMGITVKKNQSGDFLKDLTGKVDCIYLDPSRRLVTGQRLYQLEGYQPDVVALKELLFQKSRMILIKLSPLLDIDYVVNRLGHVEKVFVIAVNNECKELLFRVNGNAQNTEPVIDAVNLETAGEDYQPVSKHVTFTRREEADAIPDFSSPLHYLYEPNAAILKAGAFKMIAHRYGIKKLHPNSHLYTSSELVTDFPGRVFTTDKVLSYNKKRIKAEIKGGKANMTTRNFPVDVKTLRKQLQLGEGGDIYLFATTDKDGKGVILKCRKV